MLLGLLGLLVLSVLAGLGVVVQRRHQRRVRLELSKPSLRSVPPKVE